MTDIILLQTKCGMWDVMGVRTPIGLLSIAAVPCQQDYKIVLIDQRINPGWKKDVKKHISLGAKMVCLTTMVGEQIKFMMEASKFVKSLNKEVIVFLGGSWAQTEPEMCLQDKNVDIVCYGEGDFLLPEIMEYQKGNIGIEDIKGIAYQTKKGEIKKNPQRPLIENIDELPMIPYHLVNMGDYKAINLRPNKPSMSIVTSRGCGFRCNFCSVSSMYGQRWRGYSIKRVMKELEYIETEYGITDFCINDDNMAGDYGRFIELISALAKSSKGYNWGGTGIRADTIIRMSDKEMRTLVKSGCKNIDIGVESGNPRILRLVNKCVTLETIKKANIKLSRYPIIIRYSFMGGFPTETEKEFIDTLKFRKKLLEDNKNATAPIFFYTPFPKTPFFDLAVSKGLEAPATLEGWVDFNYDTWYKEYPSWLTKGMIKLVENAVFLSYFADKNMGYKFANPLMNALFRAYYPVAKFRYNHDFYGLMFEKSLAEFIGKLNNKFNFFSRTKKDTKKKTKAKAH